METVKGASLKKATQEWVRVELSGGRERAFGPWRLRWDLCGLVRGVWVRAVEEDGQQGEP